MGTIGKVKIHYRLERFEDGQVYEVWGHPTKRKYFRLWKGSMPTHKKCYCCKQLLPVNCFYYNPIKKFCLSNLCKACTYDYYKRNKAKEKTERYKQFIKSKEDETKRE